MPAGSIPRRAGAVVLGSRTELDAAAAGLDACGWSWPRRGRVVTRAWWEAAELGLVGYPLHRDRTKSWDVWRAVHHLQQTLTGRRRVFDVGAWQSEVLWALGQAGFAELSGCDTDRRVVRMPGRERIRYEAVDFFEAALAPASLEAITCLSVIEHGMDVECFLDRAARALRPGGRLILTTDYWPDPVDTRGLEAFGLPWRVFSRPEVESLIDAAGRMGLEPDGPVSFEASEAPITWNDRSYTFVWLALTRGRVSA